MIDGPADLLRKRGRRARAGDVGPQTGNQWTTTRAQQLRGFGNRCFQRNRFAVDPGTIHTGPAIALRNWRTPALGIVLDVGETLILPGRALERTAVLAGLPVHDILDFLRQFEVFVRDSF